MNSENGLSNDPVVIVGMALEAPGGVDSADSFWDLLAGQREALGPFPGDRGWSVTDLLEGDTGPHGIPDRGNTGLAIGTLPPYY